MINITLPDRSQKKYNKPLTGLDIAKSISQSLTKEAIAIKANDNIQDLNQKISSDCTIEIITKKSPEALEIVRHDAAHIMAEAVQYQLKMDSIMTLIVNNLLHLKILLKLRKK